MSRYIYRLTHETHATWQTFSAAKFKELNEIETIAKPRPSVFDNREARIRLALGKICLDEKTEVEGVRVERCGTERRVVRFIVNHCEREDMESAIAHICRILDNRKNSE